MSEDVIIQVGHPTLRQVADAVADDFPTSPQGCGLVQRLFAKLQSMRMIGLAAPQLDEGVELLVMEDLEEYLEPYSADLLQLQGRVPFPATAMFNPTWRPRGAATTVFFEGCGSVPGLTALVERFLEVEVDFIGEDGVQRKLELRGWPARLFQHEVDHLQGVLYTDKMIPRSLCTFEEAKKRWMERPVEEVLASLGATRRPHAPIPAT